MFDPNRKSTGTQFPKIVALLMLAFVFTPAVLLASRPFGYVSVLVALVCSAFCASYAWVNWKNYSQMTGPLLAASK